MFEYEENRFINLNEVAHFKLERVEYYDIKNIQEKKSGIVFKFILKSGEKINSSIIPAKEAEKTFYKLKSEMGTK